MTFLGWRKSDPFGKANRDLQRSGMKRSRLGHSSHQKSGLFGPKSRVPYLPEVFMKKINSYNQELLLLQTFIEDGECYLYYFKHQEANTDNSQANISPS